MLHYTQLVLSVLIVNWGTPVLIAWQQTSYWVRLLYHSLRHQLTTPKPVQLLPAHMSDILTERGRNARVTDTLGDSGDLWEQEPSGFHRRGGASVLP